MYIHSAGADLEHNLGGGPRACKRYWPSQRGKVREGVPFSVRSAEALTFLSSKSSFNNYYYCYKKCTLSITTYN